MEQNRLNLYTVNMKYIRNLHNQGDDRVFSVSPQVGKDNRPFVGIVVICGEKQYCIPLSSPKEKHRCHFLFHQTLCPCRRLYSLQ